TAELVAIRSAVHQHAHGVVGLLRQAHGKLRVRFSSRITYRTHRGLEQFQKPEIHIHVKKAAERLTVRSKPLNTTFAVKNNAPGGSDATAQDIPHRPCPVDRWPGARRTGSRRW